MAVPSSLDLAAKDGFGESLQRGTLFLSETSLLVQEGDSGRVPRQGGGMSVTEGLEVVMYGMANNNLPHEQPQDLLPGLCVRWGIEEVSGTNAAPSCAVIRNGHGGLDELIVDHIPVVRDDTAASQLTDAAFGSSTHHLAVNGEVLGGVPCTGGEFMAAG